MQGEETPTWWATPFREPLDIDWRQEGDEWLHHVWVALDEEVDIIGHGASPQQPSPEFPLPHLVFVPTSNQLKSRLRLVPLERGLLVVISGTDSPESADPRQIQPWVTAIDKATARIGRDHQSFEWSAIIGPLSGMESSHIVLASEANVSALRLYPAEHHLTEHVESPAQPSLFSRTSSWSWPIVVEGESIGYNWHTAAAAGTREVHRLAALLSLAWDGCWIIRQAPTMRSEDGRRLETPTRPWWDASLENEPAQDDDALGFERQPLPDWLAQAWEMLDDDPTLEDALLVHHEGRALQQQGHDSFAMIAFVSSIETIGAKLGEMERCECCGTITGSTERFRRALALVIDDEEERKALARMAYGRRSKTAHAGQLHGTEAAPGTLVSGASFFSQNAGTQFMMNVFAVRKASRDLLLRILRDGLMPTA